MECHGNTMVLALLFTLLGYTSTYSPEVQTKLGSIRGKQVFLQDGIVDTFLSVPFATPPVGDLRFKRPLPVQPWNGILQATNYPPACLQYSPSPFPWKDNFTGQSEDCLYLNIWVPNPPRKGRSVLFWIFSGGFNFGSNRLPVYDGADLAAVGDIIVVNVNYRVGVFGFFYSGTEDAPGNMGLYDSLLGLKWVKENIEEFGGDPNSITISGHSAGSVTCQFFSVSPLTKGLYKRSIMASGSLVGNSDGKETNLKLGQNLAKQVGCANDTTTLEISPDIVVDCLKRVDAVNLAYLTGKMEPLATVIFMIVYGDPIVGGNPRESLQNKKVHNSDIFIGFNAEDSAFHIPNKYPDVFGFFGDKNTLFNKTYGEMLLKTLVKTVKVDEKFIQYYYGDIDDDNKPEIRERTIAAVSDSGVICPSIYSSEIYAEKGKVHFYFFDRRPSKTVWAPWMGVVHFDDVPFIFGIPHVYQEDYTGKENHLSIEIMRMWSNYVKYGYPDETWSLYSKADHNAKILKNPGQPVYEEVPHLQACDFLRPYFTKAGFTPLV